MVQRINLAKTGRTASAALMALVLGLAQGGLLAQDAAAAPETDAASADSSSGGILGDYGYLWGPDEAYSISYSELKLSDDMPLPIEIGGWIQAGYTSRSTGMFNDTRDRFNVHQAWFYAEKSVDGKNDEDGNAALEIGGRVDFMYGIDAANTQSFGNNAGRFDYLSGWDTGGGYGFAMPQLYAEAAYGDVSVKAGHFYTLLGYEVVTAPDNFFYSHAFTMYNSEAFTHTGALGTYSGIDGFEVYGGYTLGWDTGFDQNNGGSSFLGGVSTSKLGEMLEQSIDVTFIATVGDLGAIGDGYSHSIVASWTDITDSGLEYIIQSDTLRANNGNFDTFGVNQYLLQPLNDVLKAGARFEWWKADGTSYYAATAGVNYKPIANLTLRPELRYQWSPSAHGSAAANVPVDELILGCDAILTF